MALRRRPRRQPGCRWRLTGARDKHGGAKGGRVLAEGVVATSTLAGKVALVTGGSRGIGRGIAARLAADGAAVAFSYIANEAGARETQEALTALGADAEAVRADSGDVEQIARLANRVAERFGKIDILVSNAGVEYFGAIQDTRPEDFDRVFGVNTRGQFFLVQQALPFMPSGGRIVCSSSVSVGTPFARHAVYAASKGAVEAMVRNLALDLGPRGITINAVAPGPVMTDMAKETTAEYLRDYPGWALEDVIRAKVAAGRLGTPGDIAHVIAYLVSDQASWITGQTIHVDGGTH